MTRLDEDNDSAAVAEIYVIARSAMFAPLANSFMLFNK